MCSVFLFMLGFEMRLSLKFLNGCKSLVSMLFAALTHNKVFDDDNEVQDEDYLNQAMTFRLETLKRVDFISAPVFGCALDVFVFLVCFPWKINSMHNLDL